MPESKTTIKICEYHQERQTPLIWTFEFPGAEYYCPHCGYMDGMFGAGRDVPMTDELAQRVKEDKEKYLAARKERANAA